MRSSILVLLFAAVFVLARPIEDIVDTQDISDLADKGKPAAKPAAKKPAPKKPTTSTKTKSTSSKSGAVKGAVVDILGQAAHGAASGVTSTLTTAAIDALTPSAEEAPVAEEPAPDA